jgi:1-acyl-sn-glycerol-3-phosphate acyltransferase
MLYRFDKILMWITLRIFFRKIRIIGIEKLLNNKPAILIANHSASFLDAMVLTVFLKRPLYFFVRGDIFHHPLVYKIFTMIHMVPIFSGDDGKDNLAKNKNTFNRGRDILHGNKLLLIFPEGFSRLSKSITPFKKGTARVAFQTAFDSNLKEDLTIETVALNYSFHGFRSDLVIRVGDSINIASYEDLYRTQPNHAISKLTLNMYDVFEKNVLHVVQPERTLFVESLLRMLFVDVQCDATSFFEKGRFVCAHISSLSVEAFSIAQQDLIDYETKIYNYGILDNEISQPPTGLFGRTFLSMLFSPFALLGFFIWQLIFKLTKWIADKTVTRDDFYTSVFSGVAGVLGLIWWLILCIVALSMGNSVGFMVVAVSPIFYYFSLIWMEELRHLKSSFKARSLVKRQSSLHQSFVLWRRKIAFWKP